MGIHTKSANVFPRLVPPIPTCSIGLRYLVVAIVPHSVPRCFRGRLVR